MIERITPEMVKAAYVATGLKPARHGCLRENGMACGAGVVAYQAIMAEGKRPSSAHELRERAEAMFGEAYIEEFTGGFDGYRHAEGVGYRDGKACAAAVFNVS
jgi:hypothetical protein